MRRSSNESWINHNNNEVVNMEHLWDRWSPHGGDLKECTGFMANDCTYHVNTCKSKECFICAWKDTPVFTLRGLCTNTKIDKQFVLLPERTFGGNVFFFGIGQSNIIFNKETSSWLIVKNTLDEIFQRGFQSNSLNNIGTLQPVQFSTHHLPVGNHFWNLTENCNKVLQLKLTRVRNEIT